MRILSLAALSAGFVMIGCGVGPVDQSTVTSLPGAEIHGAVYGGQQPISGAHIYLYQAGTAGYSSAATSLMTRGDGQDTRGYYRLTDAGGYFTVTGDYACTPNALVYVVAASGNPGVGGNGNNDKIMQIDLLGTCPSNGTFYGAIPSIMINELTTVAAAYALAPFATDAYHVGAPNTTQAQAGLLTAFQSAHQVVNGYTGKVQSTTAEISGYAAASGLSANGTVDAARINTLGNILATCVNSLGTDGPCDALFTLAPNSDGSKAADQFSAALNMARNPGRNVSSLFNMVPTNAPFNPGLSSTPTDLAIAVTYTAPNASTPMRSALDANGNLWIPNAGNSSLTQLTPLGAVASGTAGFKGASLSSPQGLAVQPTSGSVYVANGGSNKLSIFNSGGTQSGTAGPSLGQSSATGNAVSFDASGNAYAGMSTGMAYVNGLGALTWPLTNMTGNCYGVSVTGSTMFASGYTGNKLYAMALGLLSVSSTSASLNSPTGSSVDANGNIWVANNGNNTLSMYTMGSNSFSAGFTGGGLNSPWNTAVDGDGNVFTSNSNGTLSKFTNAGVATSPSVGFKSGSTAGIYSVSIDNAGNVWAPASDGKVYKFLGMAAPVSLPLNPSTAGVRP